MQRSFRSLGLALLPVLALGTSGYTLPVCTGCEDAVAPAPVISSPLALHDARAELPVPGAAALPSLPPSVDPGSATRRAYFFPGGGHFYTGETMRGAALLGVAGGSLLAGALLSSRGGRCSSGDSGCVYDHEAHEYRRESSRTPLYIGAAVAAGSWIYGIVDARSSAARMNRRNGVALGPVAAHPEPLLGVGLDGRTEVGVRLRLAR
jgi:hypothetical protein